VLGHLCLKDLLHHPLDDLTQEVGIVEQNLLHQLRVQPTMIFGHRHSVSIGCLRTPTILEDDGLSFLAAHQFTELYGHNLREPLRIQPSHSA